jgi:hypothetical protein
MLAFLQRGLKLSGAIASTLMLVVALLGLPLWLLYLLIAPFFESEPVGHLVKVLSGAGVLAAIGLGLAGSLMIAGKLYERFKVARVIAKGATGDPCCTHRPRWLASVHEWKVFSLHPQSIL